MMYFANPTGSALKAIMSGELGYIDTPAQGNRRPANVTWCADNGCFSSNFNEAQWWQWLVKNRGDAPDCAFATAPDVVGDHHATLHRSLPWLPRIRQLGYPAAFVAQDGITADTTPWDEFDCLFIGGSTEFKLADTTLNLISAAKRRDKWVHIGRVNSRRRYMRFAQVADSCDGTYLVFGPDINLPKLLGWIREHKTRQPLWAAL